MSGSGLWQFLIICVELCLIGAMIFLGIDYVITAQEGFKRIAKLAVGGALLLYFLFAVGAVLGLGGGSAAAAISPMSLLQLAITIIVLFVVIYICTLVVNRFAPEPVRAIILFVVSAIAIIIMLIVAANVLSGGALMTGAGHNFQLK
jgi:hypothetical protein